MKMNEIIWHNRARKQMGAHTEPQIITHNGKPAFAVIPWDEYQRLTAKDAYVWFPNDVVKANSRGVSLIKAWREHFGLTQEALATRRRDEKDADRVSRRCRVTLR